MTVGSEMCMHVLRKNALLLKCGSYSGDYLTGFDETDKEIDMMTNL